MKRNAFDRLITDSLCEEAKDIDASELVKTRIDREITRREKIIPMQNERRNKMSMKKIVAIIAAACVVIPTGVFAAGKITGYSSSSADDKIYSSYDDIEKAEDYAGYDIDSAENIGNGYEFSSMKVGTVDKEDDENNTVGSFKDISIEYTNGTYTIDADISQIQPEDEDASAIETKQSGDVTLSYYTDHYKFVPADYELTDEDKQNETQDHYYISYGTNEIEEHDYQYVSWKKGDLNYLLSAKDLSLSSDEMFEMAEKYLEGSDGLADNPQE